MSTLKELIAKATTGENLLGLLLECMHEADVTIDEVLYHNLEFDDMWKLKSDCYEIEIRNDEGSRTAPYDSVFCLAVAPTRTFVLFWGEDDRSYLVESFRNIPKTNKE